MPQTPGATPHAIRCKADEYAVRGDHALAEILRAVADEMEAEGPGGALSPGLAGPLDLDGRGELRDVGTGWRGRWQRRSPTG